MAASSADRRSGFLKKPSSLIDDILGHEKYMHSLQDKRGVLKQELRKAINAYIELTNEHTSEVSKLARSIWLPAHTSQAEINTQVIIDDQVTYEKEAKRALDNIYAAEMKYARSIEKYEYTKKQHDYLVDQEERACAIQDEANEATRKTRAEDNMVRLKEEEREQKDITLAWSEDRRSRKLDGEDLADFAATSMRRAMLANQNAIEKSSDFKSWHRFTNESKQSEHESLRYMVTAQGLRNSHLSRIVDIFSRISKKKVEARAIRADIVVDASIERSIRPEIIRESKRLLESIEKSYDLAMKTIKTVIPVPSQHPTEFVFDSAKYRVLAEQRIGDTFVHVDIIDRDLDKLRVLRNN
jgi:hypothetical protein